MRIDKIKEQLDEADNAVAWCKANINFIENDSYHINNPAEMEKALQAEKDKLHTANLKKHAVIRLYIHALEKEAEKTEQCIVTL